MFFLFIICEHPTTGSKKRLALGAIGTSTRRRKISERSGAWDIHGMGKNLKNKHLEIFTWSKTIYINFLGCWKTWNACRNSEAECWQPLLENRMSQSKMTVCERPNLVRHYKTLLWDTLGTTALICSSGFQSLGRHPIAMSHFAGDTLGMTC